MSQQDSIEVAKVIVKDVLVKNGVKRKPEAVDALAFEIVTSISHLISLQASPKKGKLGATVMTEDAAQGFGKPRHL